MGCLLNCVQMYIKSASYHTGSINNVLFSGERLTAEWDKSHNHQTVTDWSETYLLDIGRETKQKP